MGESGECYICGIDMWSWSFKKAEKHIKNHNGVNIID